MSRSIQFLLFLICFPLNLAGQLNNAHDTWIRQYDVSGRTTGILYELTDTYVIVLNTSDEESYLADSYTLDTLAAWNIKSIKTRHVKRPKEFLAEYTISGFLSSLSIAVLDGEDGCSDGCFTPGTKIAFVLIATPFSALIGLIKGLRKTSFYINGNPDIYFYYLEELKNKSLIIEPLE